jgi:hypothetical protein
MKQNPAFLSTLDPTCTTELEGDGCEKQQIYIIATLQLFWNEKLRRIER